jgi:hydrogenase-4 membrane subunit HyfE
MFGSLWEKLQGWKTIIGFILLNIPYVVDNPILADAINRVIEEGSAASVSNLVVVLIVLTGVLDRFKRNLKGVR